MKDLILVVDDDLDCRELLQQVLEHEGHGVVCARNGLEALMIARKQDPQLILLDLMMPVMDGYEFRARQKCDPSIAGIPVICISGTHDAGRAAQQMGAVACVEKPIALDELVAKVSEHITLTSPTRSVCADSIAKTATTGQNSGAAGLP